MGSRIPSGLVLIILGTWTIGQTVAGSLARRLINLGPEGQARIAAVQGEGGPALPGGGFGGGAGGGW